MKMENIIEKLKQMKEVDIVTEEIKDNKENLEEEIEKARYEIGTLRGSISSCNYDLKSLGDISSRRMKIKEMVKEMEVWNKKLKELEDKQEETKQEGIDRKKKIKEEERAQKKKEYEEWETKMNNATKSDDTDNPWPNEYKPYTDEEFKMAIEGDYNNEKHLITAGKKLGRKATAINVQIELRNRCLEEGEVPKNFWGRSIPGGIKDLPNKLDHNGRQFKKIVLGDMEDYYRRFI